MTLQAEHIVSIYCGKRLKEECWHAARWQDAVLCHCWDSLQTGLSLSASSHPPPFTRTNTQAHIHTHAGGGNNTAVIVDS